MEGGGLSRRRTLAALGALTSFALTGAVKPKRVVVAVNPAVSLGVTPKDFLGFGYEISTVAAGILNAGNADLLQFFRTLGGRGVVRVGGNTSDFSVWSPDGREASLPKGTVTSNVSIRNLGAFLKASGWDLIWGVNLGTGTAEMAADQAAAVAAAAGDRLRAVQIGNEPDLFTVQGHRPPSYGYAEFRREFDKFSDVVRQRIPRIPLAGPDVALSPDWVVPFARDEREKVTLLTEHYYAGGPPDNPDVTIGNLLKPDVHFLTMIRRLEALSQKSGLPYRLVELNSCFGGGKPGVSDTFASALWGLDLMFTLAAAGGAGINWETGLNHLGRVSSYSPVWDDEHGHYSARPLYYALLAFSLAGLGRRVQADVQADEINLTGYAVEAEDSHLWLTIINKDLNQDAAVTVKPAKRFSRQEVIMLSAPASDSKTGVTLGGLAVTDQGKWAGERRAGTLLSGKETEVHLRAASAALIRLS